MQKLWEQPWIYSITNKLSQSVEGLAWEKGVARLSPDFILFSKPIYDLTVRIMTLPVLPGNYYLFATAV